MQAPETPARSKLGEVPDAPGVYLFRDASGRVIYIGKAKSLRSRVRSYFQPGGSGQFPKTDALVSEVHDLEFIVARTEVEALILENNLVKKERPRYNIRLRDDKNFPYLKLTSTERFPRVVLVRRARLDGNAYFGPYLPASAARRTIQMVARHFKVATCYEHLDGTRPRPCLLYQLNQCLGPCAGLVKDEDYVRAAQDARLFLEGRTRDLVRRLKEQMAESARQEHYEAAAQHRDLIRTLERIQEKQSVSSVGLEEQDYLGFAREGEIASVQVFQMRQGQVQSRREVAFEGIVEDDAAFLAACLERYYGSSDDIPGTIVLPIEPATPDLLEAWLSERKGARVTLLVPQRGPRRRFLDTVQKNARLSFEALFRAPHTHGVEILEGLQEALGLDEPPHRIECFDISHIQGTDQVASLVVWEAGRPRRSDYRRFKIKTVAGNDDFASMAEVVGRRYARLLREGKTLPDLVLIDGGQGQLSSALAVLEGLGLGHLQVAALAKREEAIFLDGRSGPVRLPRDSPILHLVQRIRDEAHRFAVTYHRKVRSRRTLGTELLEIEGVGARRARLLLRRFGSVQGVREAASESLAEVVGARLADRIRSHLAGGRPDGPPVA
ncbi:MAG TPA: excinuclease ABC subunit UvrC [Candidatus Cryosericum sp.]|nr:excinuclease ABC subunit UvrC [Candidatus Cryosericum sp.]